MFAMFVAASAVAYVVAAQLHAVPVFIEPLYLGTPLDNHEWKINILELF